MRKIGTLSSAVGLIFIGVWIIVNNIDKGIADQLFKWWPVIIILAGLEILYFFKEGTQSEKMGFNGLLIVVVLAFFVISATQNMSARFDRIVEHGTAMSIFDSHKHNDKGIPAIKTIEVANKEIVLLAKRGKFTIKKSLDNTARIEAEVYVDQSSSLTEWDIKEVLGSNDVKVDLRDRLIEEVSGDIYIPEGCSIRFEMDNVNITSTGVDVDNFIVDSRNGQLDLRNNIKNMRANIQNGKIDIDGNVNDMQLKLQSGKIEIDNKNEKSASIKIDNGVLIYTTNNRDTIVNLAVNNGVGIVNGQKVTMGKNDVFGTGASKIDLKVTNGTIRFLNQE